MTYVTQNKIHSRAPPFRQHGFKIAQRMDSSTLVDSPVITCYFIVLAYFFPCINNMREKLGILIENNDMKPMQNAYSRL